MEKEMKVKFSRKFIIPLIIIVLLIALLIIIYLGKFRKLDAKEYYLSAINNLGSNITNSLNNYSYEKYNITSDVTINASSNDTSLTDVINLINNMKASINFNIDTTSKKASGDIELTYNDSSLIKALAYLNDKTILIDLSELYDKKITYDLESDIWNTEEVESINTILKHILTIIKDNLQDSYFTNDNDILIMKLSENDLEEYINNVLGDIQNDEEIMNYLVNSTELSKEEINDTLNEYRNDLDLDGMYLEVKINANKYTKKIETMVIDLAGVLFNIENTTGYEYTIKYENETLGTMVISDNEFSLNFNYDEIEILISMKDNKEYNFEYISKEDTLKINITNSEELTKNFFGTGNAIITIISKEEDINLTININYEIKEDVKIQEIDGSNAILYSSLMEEDYTKIVENLYSNEAYKTLLNDIEASYDVDSYSTY